jgi:hypothetical protein
MRILLNKFITTVLCCALLAGLFNFVVAPKPAQAFLGIGDISFDFNTEIANPYDIAKEIGKAAVGRIATSYANLFLTKFVDKILDKYKIQNYLYYGKLLDSYYLNQYIADKIDDPNLRDAFQAASTLYSYDLSGDTGGNVRRKQEALKKIKEAQDKYYLERGGIDPDKIYNPPADMTDTEYFALARAYFASPKSFSDQNISAQIAAAQSDAAAASAQEIAAGQGLKNSRQIVTITATGSAGLDRAMSIINNPSGYIRDQLNSAIDSIFKTNFNNDNPFAAIGSALGSFIFANLQLDSNAGDILDESGLGYSSESAPAFIEIDLDNDGIPDGRDTDRNGNLTGIDDACYHGGIPNVAPGCNKSSQVGTSPYFAPLCQGIDKAVKDTQGFIDFASAHRDQVNTDNFRNPADAQVWARRAQSAYASTDGLLSTIQDFKNPSFDNTEIALGRYVSYLNAINQSLIKDGDLELDGQWGSFDGIDRIISYTTEIINYLKAVKAAVGKCDNPNAEAAGNVPVPAGIIFPPPGSEDDGDDGSDEDECYTPEDRQQWLIDNPGDEGRIDEAFPGGPC